MKVLIALHHFANVRTKTDVLANVSLGDCDFPSATTVASALPSFANSLECFPEASLRTKLDGIPVAEEATFARMVNNILSHLHRFEENIYKGTAQLSSALSARIDAAMDAGDDIDEKALLDLAKSADAKHLLSNRLAQTTFDSSFKILAQLLPPNAALLLDSHHQTLVGMREDECAMKLFRVIATFLVSQALFRSSNNHRCDHHCDDVHHRIRRRLAPEAGVGIEGEVRGGGARGLSRRLRERLGPLEA